MTSKSFYFSSYNTFFVTTITCAIPGTNKEIVEIVGSFDEAFAGLHGVALITAEGLAEARIRLGANHPVSTYGCWTGENYNYLPNGDILIASGEHNPMLRQPREVIEAHRKGGEFYLDNKVVSELRERAEKDSERASKSGVLLLSRMAVKPKIPVTSLDEDPATYFLFRGQARAYGNFLKDNRINNVPQLVVGADYAKKQQRAFGRALWVRDIFGNWSDLDGDDLRLYGGRFRGVRRARNREDALDKAK